MPSAIGPRSSTNLTDGGTVAMRPADAPSTYDVAHRLTPSAGGPMANINAYKPTRLRNGRLRFTSQIWLSAFSTVSSRAIAVTSTNSEPAQVRLFAFAANWLRYVRTVRKISIGSRLFNRICSIACSKRLKIGKRVKSAKLTANSGTIDSTVVKVRLPATWASRSSRARRIVSRVRLIMRAPLCRQPASAFGDAADDERVIDTKCAPSGDTPSRGSAHPTRAWLRPGQPRADDREAGNHVGEATGDPHHETSELLVFEGGEAEGRRAALRVPGGRREGQQCAQCAGVKHRREQARDRRGVRCACDATAGDPPKAERGSEEAGVLQAMQRQARERRPEQRRQVPHPERECMEWPCIDRRSKQLPASAPRRRT